MNRRDLILADVHATAVSIALAIAAGKQPPPALIDSFTTAWEQLYGATPSAWKGITR